MTKPRFPGLTLGRIVRYTSEAYGDPVVCAAIVTKVEDALAGVVSLTVFPPGRLPFTTRGVTYTETTAGTKDALYRWTWPART